VKSKSFQKVKSIIGILLIISSGCLIGRGQDSKLFYYNNGYYLAKYSDLCKTFNTNANASFTHYQDFGKKEGRQASPVFNPKFYLNNYTDLQDAFRSDYAKAFEHWLTFGIKEGRQGSREFDAKYYLANNPDVAQHYGETNYAGAIQHFLDFGINEKRKGAANFDYANSAAAKQRCVSDKPGYLMETGLPIPATAHKKTFVVASNGDLFVILQTGTGSIMTEVHVLSAASDYQKFVTQTKTPIPETVRDYQFAVATNRDLFAIKNFSTGSRKTEVHVLSAASNYQKFVTQIATPLPEMSLNYAFAVAPNRDLFVIKKGGTDSRSTEVHVLSAASNYQTYILHTGTVIEETDSGGDFAFAVGANRDLFVIRHSYTSPRPVDVRVLSAASNYQEFIKQSGTIMPETADSFAFGITQNRDLFAVQKWDTKTKSTEFNILDLSIFPKP
jgi:hypothetical protein